MGGFGGDGEEGTFGGVVAVFEREGEEGGLILRGMKGEVYLLWFGVGVFWSLIVKSQSGRHFLVHELKKWKFSDTPSLASL